MKFVLLILSMFLVAGSVHAESVRERLKRVRMDESAGQVQSAEELSGGTLLSIKERLHRAQAEETEQSQKGDIESGTAAMPSEESGTQVLEVKGKTNGIIQSFYENGTPQAEYEHVNGKKEGSYKEYYDNGYVRLEGLYKKNKKSGVFKEYNSNGILVKEENYVKDKLNGTGRTYCENGLVANEQEYKSGRPKGKAVTNSCEAPPAPVP
jgi:antitoxin component YwqK of YwqJK toxin-antitoxin module